MAEPSPVASINTLTSKMAANRSQRLVVLTGSSSGFGLALCSFIEASRWPLLRIDRTLISANTYGGKVCVDLVQDQCDERLLGKLSPYISDSLNLTIVLSAAQLGPKGMTGVTQQSTSELLWLNCFSQIKIVEMLAKAYPDKSLDVWCISSGMGSVRLAVGGENILYSCSKASLNLGLRLLAKTYSNLRTISIDPGWMRTKLGGEKATYSPMDSAEKLWRLILDGAQSIPSLEDGIVGLRESDLTPW